MKQFLLDLIERAEIKPWAKSLLIEAVKFVDKIQPLDANDRSVPKEITLSELRADLGCLPKKTVAFTAEGCFRTVNQGK